jgi:hypothetical protein
MRWALVIALGVALLTLPAQAARSTDSATRTIRLVSTNVSLRAVVDRAPRGVPNNGDVVQERSLLRNAVRQFERPKGAPVGTDVATYTVVSANPVRMRMKLTVKLPGGTLRGIAQIVGNTSSVIRIVGGTGNFANARGTGEVRAQTAGAKAC